MYVTAENYQELKVWAFKLNRRIGNLDRVVCLRLEGRRPSIEQGDGGENEVRNNLFELIHQVSLACEAFPRDTVDLWAARWIGYNSNSNFHDAPVEDKVEPGEAQVAGRTVQLNASVEQLNQVQRQIQIDLAQFRQDMDDLEQLRLSGHNTKTTSSVNRNEIEEISRKWMPNSDAAEIRRSMSEREMNERRVKLRLPKYNDWIVFSSRAALASDDSVASIAAIPDDNSSASGVSAILRFRKSHYILHKPTNRYRGYISFT